MNLSERIFVAMLRAYPKAHRREYSHLMAQLFRDQMRDAAAHGQLVKAWRLIIVDFITSVCGWYRRPIRTVLIVIGLVLLTCAGWRASSTKDLWTSGGTLLAPVLRQGALATIAAFVTFDLAAVVVVFCISALVANRFDRGRQMLLRVLLTLPAIGFGSKLGIVGMVVNSGAPVLSWCLNSWVAVFFGVALSLWVTGLRDDLVLQRNSTAQPEQV